MFFSVDQEKKRTVKTQNNQSIWRPRGSLISWFQYVSMAICIPDMKRNRNTCIETANTSTYVETWMLKIVQYTMNNGQIFPIFSITSFENTNQYVFTFQWVKESNLRPKQNKGKQHGYQNQCGHPSILLDFLRGFLQLVNS